MTRGEIEAARTARGGYTKQQLAEWGVPWPPPKGWKEALIADLEDGPVCPICRDNRCTGEVGCYDDPTGGK